MREFAYGQQYAWMIMVFSVMVVFSISCPLVAPFGRCWAQTDRQTDRDGQAGRQAGRLSGRQIGREGGIDRHVGRQLGNLTDRHGEKDRL